jgi:hypothetical protein
MAKRKAKSSSTSKNKSQKSRRHEQTYIPGTEPKDVPSEVRDALNNWLDAKDEKRQLSKRESEAHEVLLTRADEAKLDRVPYVDSITGKKKHVVVASVRKAKVINAPSPRKQREAEDRERPEVEAEITVSGDDKVESRRVSRESVAAELGEEDPFAGLRSRMAADEAAPAGTEH